MTAQKRPDMVTKAMMRQMQRQATLLRLLCTYNMLGRALPKSVDDAVLQVISTTCGPRSTQRWFDKTMAAAERLILQRRRLSSRMAGAIVKLKQTETRPIPPPSVN